MDTFKMDRSRVTIYSVVSVHASKRFSLRHETSAELFTVGVSLFGDYILGSHKRSRSVEKPGESARKLASESWGSTGRGRLDTVRQFVWIDWYPSPVRAKHVVSIYPTNLESRCRRASRIAGLRLSSLPVMVSDGLMSRSADGSIPSTGTCEATVGSPDGLTWEHLARLPWSRPCLGITGDLDPSFSSSFLSLPARPRGGLSFHSPPRDVLAGGLV